MNIVTEKRCTKCGEIKPSNYFVKDPTKKDGLYSSCKDCYKIKYNNFLDKNRNRVKKYREENRDKYLASKKKTYYKNRDKNLQRMSEWHSINKNKEIEYRKENKDKINEKSREWAKNNAVRRNKVLAVWRKNNPEKVYIQKANRHSLERGSRGNVSEKEWSDLCNKYDNKCLCCGEKKKLTQDHIIPITKGGIHHIDNLQPLCRNCNSRKHTKTTDYRPHKSNGLP